MYNMKKVLNDKKGYMLVEIILASVIAFGIAAYIVNLTIKLKNKNDDMLVEMQTATDQAIIANKVMNYLKNDGSSFDCSSLTKTGNQIKYKTTILDTVTNYATVGNISCQQKESGKYVINIPISVKQLTGKNFDVSIVYIY